MKLIHGDCFEWLQDIDNSSIDMCYIDPPFFTQRDFKQFNDKWKSRGEYLTYMELRLIEIHRVLKDTGSIFLHCDHHMSHHLRILLDEVFGEKNFRSEIIWKRKTGSNSTSQKAIPSSHDTVFYFAKTKKALYRVVYLKQDEKYIKGFFKYDDGDGKGLYRITPLSTLSASSSLIYNYKGYSPPKKGWRWTKERMEQAEKDGLLIFPKDKNGCINQKQYLSKNKGKPLGSIWAGVAKVSRPKYPTQKPEKLLERIIKCSTNEGDTVLDCFCGSGTTLAVAQKLNRKWIGGDINEEAVKIAKKRLIKEILS